MSNFQSEHNSESNTIFIHSSLDDLGLSAQEFRIYAHLARRAGAGEAFPAVATIAKVCRLNEETVRSALKELAGRGMVTKQERPGQTNIYRLTAPSRWTTPPKRGGTTAKHPPETRGGHPPQTEGGDPPQTRGDEGNTLKVIQQKELPSAPEGAAGGDPEEETFLAAWNEAAEAGGFTRAMTMTAGRKKQLRARLKEKFFRDNWRAALAKIATIPWCIGKGSRKWKADVDFFLRPGAVAKIMESESGPRGGIRDAGRAQPQPDRRESQRANEDDLRAMQEWERQEEERKRKQAAELGLEMEEHA
jgi:DNA-binding MarR family transcriptional regulator